MTQEDFAEELRRISEWQEFNNALMSVCEKSEPYRVDEVHNPHDKGYKYVLSIKKYFVEFVKNFMEISLDEEIKESNITLMDKEFITVDFDKRESDLIYEVKTKTYFICLCLILFSRQYFCADDSL